MALELFADFQEASGNARSLEDDNFIKSFRAFDIYSASSDAVHRILFVSCPHDSTKLTWMRYQGTIDHTEAGWNLEMLPLLALTDKKAWTKGTYTIFQGEPGIEPFWMAIRDVLMNFCNGDMSQISRLVVNISAFGDADVNMFQHGAGLALCLQQVGALPLDTIQSHIGLSFKAQKQRRGRLPSDSVHNSLSC
jgi:hypothetical protein